MKANEIKGIKPFNGFWLNSCYDHQLLAGLGGLGIDADVFFLHDFPFVEENLKIKDRSVMDEKRMERRLGYQNKKCNIVKSSLIRRIDKGEPIIVGVDCFYLESREDYYKKIHGGHFILAYGYDQEKDIVKVVDHRYANDLHFDKKELSLTNLLLANQMYKKINGRRPYTCRALRKRRTKQVKKDDWAKELLERFVTSRTASAKNLKILEEYMTRDTGKFVEHTENIITYLQKIKRAFQCVLAGQGLADNEEIKITLTKLVNAYSNIFSVAWKVKHQHKISYLEQNAEIIRKKLGDISRYEEIVFNAMEESLR